MEAVKYNDCVNAMNSSYVYTDLTARFVADSKSLE